MQKSKSERVHAKRRAEQRFGLSLSNNDLHQLSLKIRRRDCIFLWKTSLNKKVFAVIHENNWIPVVYSKISKQIISVLPEKALEDYRDRIADYEDRKSKSKSIPLATPLPVPAVSPELPSPDDEAELEQAKQEALALNDTLYSVRVNTEEAQGFSIFDSRGCWYGFAKKEKNAWLRANRILAKKLN